MFKRTRLKLKRWRLTRDRKHIWLDFAGGVAGIEVQNLVELLDDYDIKIAEIDYQLQQS